VTKTELDADNFYDPTWPKIQDEFTTRPLAAWHLQAIRKIQVSAVCKIAKELVRYGTSLQFLLMCFVNNFSSYNELLIFVRLLWAVGTDGAGFLVAFHCTIFLYTVYFAC